MATTIAQSADVEALRFTIQEVDCEDGTPIGDPIVKDRPLSDMTLPGGIPELEDSPLDANSEHLFADLFQVVPVGCYNVASDPVTAEGEPSETCVGAFKNGVVVNEGEVTEVFLIDQCHGVDPGAIDIIEALNHEPEILDIQFEDSKFVECGTPIVVCATAVDPDHDPMVFVWALDPGAPPTSGPTVISHTEDPDTGAVTECVEFVPSAFGKFPFTLTVFDMLHAPDGSLMTFEDWLLGEGYPSESRAEFHLFFYSGTGGSGGGAIMAPPGVVASMAPDANSALLLSDTLTGGAGSPEALTALNDLGLTLDIVTSGSWATFTAADFASYRVIILGDPTCMGLGPTAAAEANATLWGPMVDGNVVLIGTDPVFHETLGGTAGAAQLTKSGIAFALGTDPSKTGLYLTLSCYYDGTAPFTPLPVLDGFGTFTATGVPGCFNDAHIVAASPALGTLTDADLSGWGCSVHEAFDTWAPDFEVLAIALTGTAYTAGDGTVGTPYILARGVISIGCGDGDVDPGEECDDGNNTDGDGCDAACNFEQCGNGIVQSGEECDDGNLDDGDGCNADCMIEGEEACGNGILEGAEECDDGNLDDGDGCSANCTIELCAGEVTKTWTTDEDFDEGETINTEHDPSDQLDLIEAGQACNVVWIAASARGTIVKIDATTGAVLGEYLSAPDGRGRNPSRTTVDANCNVWATNRDEFDGGLGSVVNIGRVENGQCEDRNGNSIIDTSTGLGDIRPWLNGGGVDNDGGVDTAEDECIIHYTRVTGTGTRHLSLDASNNVWVGGLGDQDFEQLDNATGLPIPGTQFNNACGGYGGVTDHNGIVWSAQAPQLRWDPVTDTGMCLFLVPAAYGTAIDPNTGNVWFSELGGTDSVYEIDPVANVVLQTLPQGFNGGGAQGLAVDNNSHVWVAEIFGDEVAHYAPDPGGGGFHVFVGFVPGFAGTTGVAVAHDGKIWASEINSSTTRGAARIDPNAGPIGGGGYPVGAIDLTVGLDAPSLPFAGPYNYSDMTGSQVTAPPDEGTWTVVYDSGMGEMSEWGVISWNATTPSDSQVLVQVRSSDDLVIFSAAEPVTSGADVTSADSRYLEIQVKLVRATTGESPSLADLTLTSTPL